MFKFIATFELICLIIYSIIDQSQSSIFKFDQCPNILPMNNIDLTRVIF